MIDMIATKNNILIKRLLGGAVRFIMAGAVATALFAAAPADAAGNDPYRFFHPLGLQAGKKAKSDLGSVRIDPSYGVIKLDPFNHLSFADPAMAQNPVFAPFVGTVQSIRHNDNGSASVTLLSKDGIRVNFQPVIPAEGLEQGETVIEGEKIGQLLDGRIKMLFTDPEGKFLNPDFKTSRFTSTGYNLTIEQELPAYADLDFQSLQLSMCRQFEDQLQAEYQRETRGGRGSSYPRGMSFDAWCIADQAYNRVGPQPGTPAWNDLMGDILPPPTNTNGIPPNVLSELAGFSNPPTQNPILYTGTPVPPVNNGSFGGVTSGGALNSVTDSASPYCPEEVNAALVAGQEARLARLNGLVDNSLSPPTNLHDLVCFDVFAAQMTGPIASRFSGDLGGLFESFAGSALSGMGINSGAVGDAAMGAVSDALNGAVCDVGNNLMSDIRDRGVNVDALYSGFAGEDDLMLTTVPEITEYLRPGQYPDEYYDAYDSTARFILGRD